jgi:hypothetical protein
VLSCTKCDTHQLGLCALYSKWLLSPTQNANTDICGSADPVVLQVIDPALVHSSHYWIQFVIQFCGSFCDKPELFFWVKFIELNRFTRTETSPHNWCVGQRMQATVQWCWQWIHNELDAEKQTWKTSLYSNWARVYRHLHARSPCPNGLLMFLMVQNCW